MCTELHCITGVECLSQIAYLVNRFPTVHCSGMFMKFFSNHGLNVAKYLPMLHAFPACCVRLLVPDGASSEARPSSNAYLCMLYVAMTGKTYIYISDTSPSTVERIYIACLLGKKTVMKNHCTGGILLLLSALLFQGAHTEGTYQC